MHRQHIPKTPAIGVDHLSCPKKNRSSRQLVQIRLAQVFCSCVAKQSKRYIVCLLSENYGQVSANDANCSDYGDGFCHLQRTAKPGIVLCTTSRRIHHCRIFYIQRTQTQKEFKEKVTKDLDRSLVPNHGIACMILGIACLLV